jgi:hypothetical protein
VTSGVQHCGDFPSCSERSPRTSQRDLSRHRRAIQAHKLAHQEDATETDRRDDMDTATLSPEHRKQLEQGSAISPEVIVDQHYRTITDKKELKALGVSHAQLRMPGLLPRPHTTSVGLVPKRGHKESASTAASHLASSGIANPCQSNTSSQGSARSARTNPRIWSEQRIVSATVSGHITDTRVDDEDVSPD